MPSAEIGHEQKLKTVFQLLKITIEVLRGKNAFKRRVRSTPVWILQVIARPVDGPVDRYKKFEHSSF